MNPGPVEITTRAIRTPRAAAVAGIVFSVLFATAFVLVQLAIPPGSDDAGTWVNDDAKRGAVVFGLQLVPFAGIAFWWFIGVLRDRIGPGEDRFFATVFLGSGLIFVAMFFAAGAVAAWTRPAAPARPADPCPQHMGEPSDRTTVIGDHDPDPRPALVPDSGLRLFLRSHTPS